MRILNLAVRSFFILALWAARLCNWSGSFPPVYAQETKPAGHADQSNLAVAGGGRKLFESTCAVCHGLDGRGAGRGPNIIRPEVRRRSDTEILHILQHGVPSAGMPAFGALGGAKLRSLVAHLRSLQGLDLNLLVTGDPGKGKELFFKKGSCADCHMISGRGGFLGSDLSIYGAITPLAEMREQITNHDQSPRARTIAVTTRDGRTLTGFARNEDNFSLQLQSLDGSFHFLDKSAVTNIAHPRPPATPENHEPTLRTNDLNSVISYLVTVARTSKDANKWKPPSKHGEED